MPSVRRCEDIEVEAASAQRTQHLGDHDMSARAQCINYMREMQAEKTSDLKFIFITTQTSFAIMSHTRQSELSRPVRVLRGDLQHAHAVHPIMDKSRSMASRTRSGRPAYLVTTNIKHVKEVLGAAYIRLTLEELRRLLPFCPGKDLSSGTSVDYITAFYNPGNI
ncbi:uncharacterized protein LAESUDRAFT_715965 [Laetiporus sulphureus 93-53]|uniref:Uncharacterized protein n=1 Tax=Laetiporus sulphureus 93-53 TaxID=1314785 RepID=A0A165CZD7_9APHY|nr:uncharacterized protein LAESUDRAFT_715965 [Laetiporus sulphureus 93-53]KZT03805.1 hypothetical protein LAESUDRAFT_715965 [Laetiporus sulphureus 93-53]